ncbi:CsbD family protein [Streptacidiphilus sp. PB12-B1b]|nr:CsbD family protein [Streptacidiphilus sp. PB12-B1b]
MTRGADDKASSAADKLKGKAKEGAGKVTGNERPPTGRPPACSGAHPAE